MSASTLTSKGQVTIPKEVRERLGRFFRLPHRSEGAFPGSTNDIYF